jgi:hypothetical protein
MNVRATDVSNTAARAGHDRRARKIIEAGRIGGGKWNHSLLIPR